MASGALVALWFLVFSTGLPPRVDGIAGDEMRRVRGATPKEQALIAEGTLRSSTFAALVRQIQRTDVIVMITVARQMPSGLEGRLVFMCVAGGVRYLRVEVREGTGPAATIALIGHELQHALEIALHPEVRGPWQMAALYERIGERGHVPHQYETSAARAAGYRVRQELS